MSDDYAKAAASPRGLRIGGAEYLVGKFTPRDLGDLGAWLKDQVPDPRLKARELCAGLSDAVALAIWRDLSDEARDWPPSIESYQGNRLLLGTYEGNARLLWVGLRRHNPGVTLEVAARLAEHITLDEVSALVRLGFPEETFDPKATPATEPMATENRGPVPMPVTSGPVPFSPSITAGPSPPSTT